MLNYHRFMGFYYTPFWLALLGMHDLVHGPRPEQNDPVQLSSGNTLERTRVCALWSVDRGSWFPVHGPGQYGVITRGQVSCSEMLGVLSLNEATKSPYPSQAVFSDSTHLTTQPKTFSGFVTRGAEKLRCTL
jgi:hypothetical protein